MLASLVWYLYSLFFPHHPQIAQPLKSPSQTPRYSTLPSCTCPQPANLNLVASNLPNPSLGATFRLL